MRHVMLDLETWGTRPGAALRSIGAVSFEMADFISADNFYRNIDEQSCLEAGLEVDRDTQEWWSRQSAEAQGAFIVDPMPLRLVAEEFHEWWRAQGARYVWCHGGNFDEPLWTAAARAINSRVPWKYWDARCTRTLYHMAEFDPRSLAREGSHHNALDDALFQVRCVQESYRRLQMRAAA